MILFILCFLTVSYIFYFYYQVSKYPKGPFPIPFFGNTLQMTPNKLVIDLERWRIQHGDVFTIWAMTKPIIVFMRFDIIKEVFITYGDLFTARPGGFPENIFQCVENGGVIFSSGDNWREQRKTSLHILREFGVGKNTMEQKVHYELEHLVDYVRSINDSEEVDFSTSLQVTVTNIISQLLYGISYPHDGCGKLMTYSENVILVLREVLASVSILFAEAIPFLRTMPYIGYWAVRRPTDKFKLCMDFVKDDVKTALEHFSKDDEPTCFVQSYFKKMDSNEFLNMGQLYNVCSDFFMAGMETTATTLRWAVLYFALYPDIQENMRKEIAKVVGFSRLPSMRDLSDMPYSTAVVVELQRVANIVAVNVMHKCENDVTISGIRIPKGTNVIPNVYGALADEEKFPEPTIFKPDRFINSEGRLNSEMINSVIPFGVGKRQCAGEPLARMELFLGITTIIQKFKLFPSSSGPVDMEQHFSSIILPTPQPLRVENVNPEVY